MPILFSTDVGGPMITMREYRILYKTGIFDGVEINWKTAQYYRNGTIAGNSNGVFVVLYLIK